MTPESNRMEIPNFKTRLSNHRGLITACLLTTLLWGMHAVWFLHDTRPPVWDMALHQTYALNYLGGNVEGEVRGLRQYWMDNDFTEPPHCSPRGCENHRQRTIRSHHPEPPGPRCRIGPPGTVLHYLR